MATGHRVEGTNAQALFDLTVHRGDGMALLAMNWRQGRPPDNFVGFGIEFFPPGASTALNINNRLSFEGAPDFGERRPSLEAPFQKFRWVHFPFDADKPGKFRYRVTPVFMDSNDDLLRGDPQEVEIELARETYPGKLNVSFTRGFVASQAFVEYFVKNEDVVTDEEISDAMASLLPAEAKDGLTFVPTHENAAKAYAWMGFEARRSVLEVLDTAIADPDASVSVVAYDLSQSEVVSRLEALGDRVRVIIDDSKDHKEEGSGENQAFDRLVASAGAENVQRQHMGKLQHNKTIVVTGPNGHTAVCGSTNFSWRGFYVQNNNAVVITGKDAIKPFVDAFEQYWTAGSKAFRKSPSAEWTQLDLDGIDVSVCFSPHSDDNAVLNSIADDIRSATSSVLYSLAFLGQTNGSVTDALKEVTKDPDIFVAGISDKRVKGITVLTPDGNQAPVRPEALVKHVPAPFSKEATGGGGARLHHKFVVIDFDKPTARVYFGSYNFSEPADTGNGENLLLAKDQRIATSYAIEAVRIFDHYQFRVLQLDEDTARDRLVLQVPPQGANEKPWFDEDYTNGNKIRDRELFA